LDHGFRGWCIPCNSSGKDQVNDKTFPKCFLQRQVENKIFFRGLMAIIFTTKGRQFQVRLITKSVFGRIGIPETEQSIYCLESLF